MHRTVSIAARVVAALGIGFLSLFALDVFEPGAPPLQIATALLMHLLPSFVLIGVLAIAVKWPLAGGLLYLGLAAAAFVLLSNPFWVNAMLAGPFIVAGVLFVAAAVTHDKRA